jgi:5-methylcytosine-specific restriction endonuclease McrA
MAPGWGATRARVLARDGHHCRQCGAEATEVHHTVPGAESEDLMLSLCAACHLPVTLAQAQAARRLAS